MDAGHRLKVEMGGRTHAFCLAHSIDNPGFTTSMNHLGGLAERAITLFAQQRSGEVTERASTTQRNLLLDKGRAELKHLHTIAEAGAQESPGLVERFRVPAAGEGQEKILTAIRTSIAEVEARKDFFIRFGMDPTTPDTLKQVLVDFSEAVDDGRAGRRAHVGARAELDHVGADIMTTVNHLDGIIRHHFKDNPELLAAWESARDVAWPSSKVEPGVPAESGADEKKAEPAA